MAKKSTTKKSTVSKASKARTRKSVAASTRTKKTQGVATVASTKAKKASAKKEPSATQKKRTADSRGLLAMLKSLRGLHLLAGLLYAGLIVAVYTMMSVVERTITLGYTTSDRLLGGDAIAPAVRNFTALDVRHVLTVALAVGLLYSLYIASSGWSRYQKQIKTETVPIRWVYAALSIATGGLLMSLVHGVYDAVQLLLIVAMLVVSVVLASKVYALVDLKLRMKLFLTAVIVGSIAILALALFILFSMVYGIEVLPIGLYIAVDVFALGVLAYALNQYGQLKGWKRLASTKLVERNFALISVFTTLGVSLSLLFSFMA